MYTDSFMYVMLQIGLVAGPGETMVEKTYKVNRTLLCRPTDFDPQREMIAAYAGLVIMFVMAVYAM